jgi:hypothetical protein
MTREAGAVRKRILIACIQEKQSYHAGLELARRFPGHAITFVGLSSREHQELVEANGFEFLGLGDFVEDHPEALRGGRGLRRLRLYAENGARVRSAYAELARYRGVFDVALLDVVGGTCPAAICGELGVPMLCFCNGYTSSLSWRYPPAFSRRVPTGAEAGLGERLVNLLSWTYGLFRRLGPAGRWLYWVLALPRMLGDWRVRRRAARFGVRFGLGEWGVRLRTPEIAIAYQPLDWPALQKTEGRFYLQRSSRSRHAPGAGYVKDHSVTATPLVYFSMGAAFSAGERIRAFAPRRRRRIERYLDVVIEAFSARSEWRLIMALVDWVGVLERKFLPPNVSVQRWVDQDEVLSRAAVAITGGGSSTIHDCVCFGVPMLVVPLWADHFGNAARIAYHGLGISERLDELTSGKLVRLVERLLTDPQIADSLAKAHARFHAAQAGDDRGELARFVERHTSVSLGG